MSVVDLPGLKPHCFASGREKPEERPSQQFWGAKCLGSCHSHCNRPWSCRGWWRHAYFEEHSPFPNKGRGVRADVAWVLVSQSSKSLVGCHQPLGLSCLPKHLLPCRVHLLLEARQTPPWSACRDRVKRRPWHLVLGRTELEVVF